MGFVEIAVAFLIFVIIFTVELVLALFLNWVDQIEIDSGFGFLIMTVLDCIALAITVTHILVTKAMI